MIQKLGTFNWEMVQSLITLSSETHGNIGANKLLQTQTQFFLCRITKTVKLPERTFLGVWEVFREPTVCQD